MIITNRKQLRTTSRKITDLETHRAELAEARALPDRDSNAITMELVSVDEMLEDLREQVAEYERLEGSQPAEMYVDSLDELPKTVIRARIAAGLTQADLANKCNLATSAIERYERDGYKTAGLLRLTELIDAIGILLTITHSRERTPTSSSPSLNEHVCLYGGGAVFQTKAEATAAAKAFVTKHGSNEIIHGFDPAVFEPGVWKLSSPFSALHVVPVEIAHESLILGGSE